MPSGPGTYGSKKGRPPSKPSLKLQPRTMSPDIKRKLKEILEKQAKKAAAEAQKANAKATQKRKTKKTRKPKYNPYGPGRMNPTQASYGTGP